MKTTITLFSFLLLQFVGPAQNVGIGTDAPAYLLHVAGTTYSQELRSTHSRTLSTMLVGANSIAPGYKLHVASGNTLLDGDVDINDDLKVLANVGVGAVPVAGRRIYAAGSIEATGTLYSNYLYVNNYATIGTNLAVGGNLNLTGDGITDGNFRINGRIGINGATNASYGLFVNNANSYFQGNIIVSGNTTVGGNLSVGGITNAAGGLTIGGKGHVKSAGSSNLNIGFASKYISLNIDAFSSEEFTVNLDDFSGTNNDVRVFVSQIYQNDPASGGGWKFCEFSVHDIDPVANTCKLVVFNPRNILTFAQCTVYFTTIAKD